MLSLHSLITTRLAVNRYWLPKGADRAMHLLCVGVPFEEAPMVLDGRDLYSVISAGTGMFGIVHRTLP